MKIVGSYWRNCTKIIGLISLIFTVSNTFNRKVSAQGFSFRGTPGLGSTRPSHVIDCLKQLEYKEVLKWITIGIDTFAGSGSGVVLGKKGDTWAALTAAHVCKGSSASEIEVYSPTTKQYYEVLSTTDITQDDVDIGIIKFRSNDNLSIAIINFNLLTTPHPLSQRPMGKQWGLTFDGAVSAGVSMPSGAVTVLVLR